MLKILRRKSKAKKPVGSMEPKEPAKPRRVTRKHVVISCASLIGLLTAAAPFVTSIAPFFTAPQRVESAPNKPATLVSAAPAPDPDRRARWNREVTAVITWPPGAPLQAGPNKDTMVKVNIPVDAKVTIKSWTCRNHDDIVSEMQGRWCQAVYKQDGKLHRGWAFDAYFQREEENR